MTPRLKFLTAGLILSIIFAINDYIQRQKESNGDAPVRQEINTRPKTTSVGQERIKRIREKSAKLAKTKSRTESVVSSDEMLPVPESIDTLDGWSRNPFIEEKSQIKTPLDSDSKTGSTASFSGLDNLNITSVAKMGDKVFVIINGQRFQEGDFINNVLIESIESKKITFKMGKTRIIKDVGT